MGLTKAVIQIEGNSTKIPVLFNPAEYHISRASQVCSKETPGTEVQDTQFISVPPSTLSMTLYFNTYTPPTLGLQGQVEEESGTSVMDVVAKFGKLLQIDSSLHRIPKATFIWGALIFTGFVESMEEKYTMFLPDGTPVRATVDIKIKESTGDDAAKSSKPRLSPDRTKVRTIKEGEQLWHHAYKEYDDPEQWRLIAEANGIVNPLDIYAGQSIKLPAHK